LHLGVINHFLIAVCCCTVLWNQIYHSLHSTR